MGCFVEGVEAIAVWNESIPLLVAEELPINPPSSTRVGVSVAQQSSLCIDLFGIGETRVTKISV